MTPDEIPLWLGWVCLGLLLAGACLLGVAVRRFTCLYLNRLAKRTRAQSDDLLAGALCLPLSIAVPIVAVQLAFAAIPYVFPLETFLRQLLAVGLCVVGGWTAIRVVQVAGQVLVLRAQSRGRSPATQRSITTRVRLLTRTVNVVLIIVVGALVLMSIPAVRELGASILASAGIAGIVAGLAARSVLGNLLAGVQVAISEPILIGDAVLIEGEFATIEEIRASYVVAKIWDQRRLIVPISYFLENRFENWTFRDRTELLGTVMIHADYSVSVEALRQDLNRIVSESPLWDRKVVVLQVTDCTEKTLQLRALVSAADAGTLWNLRCEVREKLAAALREKQGESLPRVRCELQDGQGRGSVGPGKPRQGALSLR